MKPKIDIDSIKGLFVPESIRSCPCCHGVLIISDLTSFSYADGLILEIDNIEVECLIEHDDYGCDWMLVEKQVLTWLNENHVFTWGIRDRELLSRWRAAVGENVFQVKKVEEQA